MSGIAGHVQQRNSRADRAAPTLTLRPDDTSAQESLALVDKLLVEHANGSALTKANYEELAALAEKQGRPEARVFRGLAEAAK